MCGKRPNHSQEECKRPTVLAVAGVSLLLLAGGCVNGPSRPVNAETAVKRDTATIQYWIDQPATIRVTADNYDQLWRACDRVAHRYLFAIDRTDYREGLLTSQPMISKYFTEFWRSDVVTAADMANSTLATYRRTLRYEMRPTPDGKFEAAVKVIVERSTSFERRVTTAIQYRDAFSGFSPGTEFYAEDGSVQPAQTWYAVGRDLALETEIGKRVQDSLR
ncbi:hypothetical protein BH10PLA1_BH10PLA1_11100 [soil metagenome]